MCASSTITNEIFELNRRHELDAEKFIDEFKINLAMSLSTIINILDPDAFVFGGGVSNEIDFLSEIETLIKKYVVVKITMEMCNQILWLKAMDL